MFAMDSSFAFKKQKKNALEIRQNFDVLESVFLLFSWRLCSKAFLKILFLTRGHVAGIERVCPSI